VRGYVLDTPLGLLDVRNHAAGAVHHEDDVGLVVLLQQPLEQILAILESASENFHLLIRSQASQIKETPFREKSVSGFATAFQLRHLQEIHFYALLEIGVLNTYKEDQQNPVKKIKKENWLRFGLDDNNFIVIFVLDIQDQELLGMRVRRV
jgi:hypothetical protein